MLRRAEVVGSSSQGSDNTVLGCVGTAGVVLHIEVGVCRLAVDGCRLIKDNQKESTRRSQCQSQITFANAARNHITSGQTLFNTLQSHKTYAYCAPIFSTLYARSLADASKNDGRSSAIQNLNENRSNLCLLQSRANWNL